MFEVKNYKNFFNYPTMKMEKEFTQILVFNNHRYYFDKNKLNQIKELQFGEKITIDDSKIVRIKKNFEISDKLKTEFI